MSNRIPNALSVGDVIRNRHSDVRYTVTDFDGDGKESVTVILTRESDGVRITRPFDKLVKNWRAVKIAP